MAKLTGKAKAAFLALMARGRKKASKKNAGLFSRRKTKKLQKSHGKDDGGRAFTAVAKQRSAVTKAKRAAKKRNAGPVAKGRGWMKLPTGARSVRVRKAGGKLVIEATRANPSKYEQWPWDGPKPTKKPRMTSPQKKALEAYKFAERQEDRYMGSVFVTPRGQREMEAKTRAAYEAAKRLGLGREHGL